MKKLPPNEVFEAYLKEALGDQQAPDLKQRILSSARDSAESTRRDENALVATRWLPAYQDTFVGRRSDLQRLGNALQKHRYVHLSGDQGVGKSRLAIHFARRESLKGSASAWFCDLRHARNSEDVCQEIAYAMNVQSQQSDVAESIGLALSGYSDPLLLLDNVENCQDTVEELTTRWLSESQRVRIMVTGRRARQSAGTNLHVAPLSMDNGNDALTLLIERSNQVEGFGFTDSGIRALEVVKGLRGLPLAIELAASSMRSETQDFSALQLQLEELDPTAPLSATLRATLDWVWQSLNPWERSALAQLSVFRNGFFADVAESVIDLSTLPGAPSIEEALDSLRKRWLIREENCERQDTTRYTVVDAIQEYAARKLEEGSIGQTRSDVVARFVARYAAIGIHNEWPEEATANWSRWLDRQHKDFTNSIAACEYALEAADGEKLQACLWALRNMFHQRSAWFLCRRLAEAGLRLPHLSWHATQRMRLSLSGALRRTGEIERSEQTVQAVRDSLEEHPDENIESQAAMNWSNHLLWKGHNREAIEPLSRAAEVCVKRGNVRGYVTCLRHLGIAYVGVNDYLYAEQAYHQARDLAQEHGFIDQLQATESGLGNLARARGDWRAALEHFQQTTELSRQIDNVIGEAIGLDSVGCALNALGRVPESIEMIQRACDLSRQTGNLRGITYSLTNLANFQMALGNLEIAHDLYQEAFPFLERLGDVFLQSYALVSRSLYWSLAGDSKREDEDCTAALGLARSVGSKPMELAALLKLGTTQLRRGHLERAAATLDIAIALSEQVQTPREVGRCKVQKASAYARLGRISEAAALLEGLEECFPYHNMAYASFIATKAEVMILAGDITPAHELLRSAEKLSEEMGYTRRSPIGRYLLELRCLLPTGQN